MDVDITKLSPPIQYSWIWLVIGLGILVVLAGWFTGVMWVTRKKKLSTLDMLGVGAHLLDLETLKFKYLAEIDTAYASYQRGALSLRGLHEAYSMSVRSFVFEVKNFPATRLTLGDLKKAPYPKLTKVIERYYKDEFALISDGDADSATLVAKEFIVGWV